MIYLRNAIALLHFWGMCCPRKGSLSLAEIRGSARWPPGKITTRRYLGQNRDRRNIRPRLADSEAGLKSTAAGFPGAIATLQPEPFTTIPLSAPRTASRRPRPCSTHAGSRAWPVRARRHRRWRRRDASADPTARRRESAVRDSDP